MIKREILDKITHWLHKEKILILKGARQVGKTTLLKEIEKHIKNNKPNATVVYLQADKIENKEIFRSASSLELYLRQNFSFPSGYTYLMIDEFQVIDQAGLFLKNVFDEYKQCLQIIVSGSSSLEITKNTEFLTGRALDFEIERITFQEYFNYTYKAVSKRIPLSNFSEIELFYKTFYSRIDLIFEQYLAFGGYPEVITTKNIADKQEILASIINRYIEKDVVDFLKVENVTAFNNLTRIISDKIGNLINKNELANTLNISIKTVRKYLEILVGTYIFDLTAPYYKNVRSEISKMPKAYILDLGIRNFLHKSFKFDGIYEGNLIENFVYLSLLSQLESNYINFYRTTAGTEIDFVIESHERKLILCEVKYRSKVSVPSAMKNFEKRYPNIVAQKIIFTKDILAQDTKNNLVFLPVNLLPFTDLSL